MLRQVLRQVTGVETGFESQTITDGRQVRIFFESISHQQSRTIFPFRFIFGVMLAQSLGDKSEAWFLRGRSLSDVGIIADHVAARVAV